MQEKILVIGAKGQVGTELTLALRKKYGNENVIASDVQDGAEYKLDVMNKVSLNDIIKRKHCQHLSLSCLAFC